MNECIGKNVESPVSRNVPPVLKEHPFSLQVYPDDIYEVGEMNNSDIIDTDNNNNNGNENNGKFFGMSCCIVTLKNK